MDLKLHNKVVLVTGGAKGIGKAVAVKLSQEGAIPAIIGRKAGDNQLVVDEIHKAGGKAFAVEAELTADKECWKAVDAVRKEFGRIEGLVNNAGVNDGVGLANGSYEGFLSSLHKNLVHYYLMVHYALPELIKSKGHIVNIGSKLAETGQGNTSGYAAANGGRNALTREWAVELLPHGIRVNAVIVAESYTPLYDSWIKTFPEPEKKLKLITDKIPLGKRMTTPEEIANAVVFLLSDVSSHTTGQLFHADGGYTHLDRSLS